MFFVERIAFIFRTRCLAILLSASSMRFYFVYSIRIWNVFIKKVTFFSLFDERARALILGAVFYSFINIDHTAPRSSFMPISCVLYIHYTACATVVSAAWKQQQQWHKSKATTTRKKKQEGKKLFINVAYVTICSVFNMRMSECCLCVVFFFFYFDSTELRLKEISFSLLIFSLRLEISFSPVHLLIVLISHSPA